MLLAGNATLLALTVTVVDDLLGDPLTSGPAKFWFLTLALVPIAVLRQRSCGGGWHAGASPGSSFGWERRRRPPTSAPRWHARLGTPRSNSRTGSRRRRAM